MTMMSFSELQTEDRRLVILQLLAESPGYRANEYLVLTALEGFGHVVSRDRLRADFAWLVEQSLVLAGETGGVLVPHLTDRGIDVAQGRAQHPGVKRPRP
jgi:hypothetical protein